MRIDLKNKKPLEILEPIPECLHEEDDKSVNNDFFENKNKILELKQNVNFQNSKDFDDWWHFKWKGINDHLNSFFYVKDFNGKEFDDNFQNEYNEIIETEFNKISFFNDIDILKNIFLQHFKDDGILDPTKGNQDIRVEFTQLIVSVRNKIIYKLALKGWDYLMKIVYWAVYSLPEAHGLIIKSVDRTLFKRKFEKLISFLTKPLLYVLILNPRTKENRIDLMKNFKEYLFDMDYFINNEKPFSKGVIRYIANGNNIKSKSSNEKNDNKINHSSKIDKFDELYFSSPASKFDDVVKEIKKDLNAFILCMKTEIYKRIRLSLRLEITMFRYKFLKSEKFWYNYVNKGIIPNNLN